MTSKRSALRSLQKLRTPRRPCLRRSCATGATFLPRPREETKTSSQRCSSLLRHKVLLANEPQPGRRQRGDSAIPSETSDHVISPPSRLFSPTPDIYEKQLSIYQMTSFQLRQQIAETKEREEDVWQASMCRLPILENLPADHVPRPRGYRSARREAEYKEEQLQRALELQGEGKKELERLLRSLEVQWGLGSR
jgi:hypothetical protein